MPARSTTLPILLLAFSALIAAPASAGAQTYPDRPVKVIVPIGPSGSYDIVGRLLADQLSKRLGQSVVVENRPGAGTIVGTQAVINAPPDGYTLLVGGLSNIVFNAGLYQKLPYDPLTDLIPVALVFNISYTLVAHKDLPYSTPNDVIAAAKKDPGGLKLANAGTGTGQHILGAAFMKFTGTKFLEVPYRGSSAAFPDLLAGRVDLFVEFDARSAALHQIRPGQRDRDPVFEAKRTNSRRADHDRSRAFPISRSIPGSACSLPPGPRRRSSRACRRRSPSRCRSSNHVSSRMAEK